MAAVAKGWNLVVAGAIILLLAGCGSGAAEGPTLSLADTKSTAQLLRNSAVERIGNGLRSEVSYSFGDSSSCAAEDEDPDGLMREWHSSTTAGVKPEYLGQVESIIDSVAAAFESEGWKSEEIMDGVRLVNPSSPTTLELSVAPNAGGVFIDAVGPCVKTDGPTSTEVTSLEGSN